MKFHLQSFKLKHSFIYDLILNKKDFFYEANDSLVKSDFKFFNDDIKETIVYNNTNYSVNNFISESTDRMNKLRVKLLSIQSITNKLLLREIIEDKFFTDIGEVLNNIEYNVKEETQVDDLYRKRKIQIVILKMNVIEILIDFLNFIKKIKYYDLKFKNNINQIYKQILNILDILSNQNPFISIYYLGNNIVNLIMTGIDGINFYFDKIKLLERYNYKVDLEFITSKLISMISNEEVNYIKLVCYSNYFNCI